MQKNWSSLYKINEQKYLHKNLFCFSMGYQNLNVMCSKWQWLQQRLIKTVEMRSNDSLILKRFWSLSLLLKSHLKIILKYAFANWVNCFYIDPRDGSASQQPESVLEADLFLNTSIGNPWFLILTKNAWIMEPVALIMQTRVAWIIQSSGLCIQDFTLQT